MRTPARKRTTKGNQLGACAFDLKITNSVNRYSTAMLCVCARDAKKVINGERFTSPCLVGVFLEQRVYRK